MSNCTYFCKNLYFDANFAATNFVLLDKTQLSNYLNYENVNIRKNPLRILQCEFRTYLLFTESQSKWSLRSNPGAVRFLWVQLTFDLNNFVCLILDLLFFKNTYIYNAKAF